MSAKTQSWTADAYDCAFHCAYDSEEPDGTMVCFRAAQGHARTAPAAPGLVAPNGCEPHTDVYGDVIYQDAAAQQLYLEILAQNQAANRAAADDPPPG